MKIALGTAQFGLDYGIANAAGKPPLAEMTKTLELAHARGVRTLDTAHAYGDAEERIGRYLAAHPDQHWRLVTKLPRTRPGQEDGAAVLDACFRQSLDRLGRPVDTCLSHDPEAFSSQEVRHTLRRLRGDGQVQKTGVSVYTERQILDALDSDVLDVVQLPLSILDRRLLRSGVLKTLKDRGVEVHARSVFLQGLLFLPAERLEARFPGAAPFVLGLKQIAEGHALSLPELALLFVAHMPEVDRVVVGFDAAGQLHEALAALERPFSREISEEILAAAECRDEQILDPSRWSAP